mgnify:CR=1 FL=1
MASYAANSTNTTNLCATAFSDITQDFTNRRFYLACNPTADALVLSTILYVKVWLYLAAITLATGYQMRSAIVDVWRPILNATEADWISTVENDCGIVTPSSTGWYSWDIPLVSFDPSVETSLRLVCASENDTLIHSITINSANNASNKPYMEIQLKNRSGLFLIMGVGDAGAAGANKTYTAGTADGTIVQTINISEPVPDTP